MTIQEAIQVLELSAPFSKAMLKKAYRDALMVWHPDRFEGNVELKAKAKNRTSRINDAYALLRDIPENSFPFQTVANNPERRSAPPSSPATSAPSPHPRASTSSPPPRSKPTEPKPRSSVHKAPNILTIVAVVVAAAGGWLLIALFQHVKSPQNNSSDVESGTSAASPSQHLTIEELREKALQGDKYAQFAIADAYMEGKGVPRDRDEAIKWYRKAADQGDMNAQWNMGQFVHQIDPEEAMRWYHKAAIQGQRFAQFYLGDGYEVGMGVERDDAEAMKWYRKASDQGHFDAQYRLGMGYLEGRGVARNPVEAVRYFRLSAQEGNAEAQTILGVCYANGDGVVKDPVEALRWYQLAADQGLSVAQYNLAMAYGLGEGANRSAVQANKWFLKAAEQGYPEAQYCIGISYHEGEGVEKNAAEAARWYRKAAEQELGSAQYALGRCLINGEGVSKSASEAVQWFQRAAEQGEAEAQSWLGACYANGEGVTKNLVLAHAWLSIASTQGVEKASKNIAIVEREMSSQQVAEAASLAAKLAKAAPNPRFHASQPNSAASLPEAPVLQHLPSDSRLTSGSILTDGLQQYAGKGKLTLVNGLTDDAFVKMISNERLVTAFYVRGGERFTFDHVPDGIYMLMYCTGFGWDADKRDFSRGRHAVRYDELLEYATTRRTEGNTIITSTGVITLTLHKVANGNTKTSDISLEEFDRY